MGQFDPRPFDHFRCRGCLQRLTFDGALQVTDEQLANCEARCDWVLIQRGGQQVGIDPVSEPQAHTPPGEDADLPQ